MVDVAYIRVSSADQNTDRQLDGLTFAKTFTDKVSGATTDRPQLQQMIEFVRCSPPLHEIATCYLDGSFIFLTVSSPIRRFNNT